MGLHNQSRPKTLRVLSCACWLASAVGCGGQENSTSSDAGAATLADTLLSAHNQLRAAVTQPSNYSGAWAPLPALIWSSALEASAQSWANNLRDTQACNPKHDPASGYGENIAGGTVGFTAADAFHLWAAEKSTYVYKPVYADSDTATVGHYSQIVWRSTTALGCATAQCSTGYLVYVCHYNPPGNVIGTQPY